MGASIYKSEHGEKIVKDFYDRQLENLDIDYEDMYIDTRFGKTHVLKTGNPNGRPILSFHGGNSTAPYSLKRNLNLAKDYLIFAPDTIGHPGKSAQTVLSPNTLEYGEWASDIIESLGYKQIICMGESFGGGILAKLMCVSPERISKAVLVVPSGISNTSTAKILFSMGIPMVVYILTKDKAWLHRAIIPMAINKESIDNDTMEMVRTTFDHVKVKAGMPSNVKTGDMKGYKAPTLLLAGEKDVLFPGEKLIDRAKEIIPNLEAHLLKDCGHMYFLSHEVNEYVDSKIVEFLSREGTVNEASVEGKI